MDEESDMDDELIDKWKRTKERVILIYFNNLNMASNLYVLKYNIRRALEDSSDPSTP